MKKLCLPIFVALFIYFSGCGFQTIPQGKNKVEAATSEVTNQYKRRADLVPNLVNTVKGYASHEKETLTAVVEARSKASQVTAYRKHKNAVDSLFMQTSAHVRKWT
jgi:LemA protein